MNASRSAHAARRESTARAKAAASLAGKEAPLRQHTAEAVGAWLEKLNGHRASGLYELVLHEVEAPLFAAVMAHVEGNQTRAADILGISRGTLRKKLKEYGLEA